MGILIMRAKNQRGAGSTSVKTLPRKRQEAAIRETA